MKIGILLTHLGALLTGLSAPLAACTIFMATQGDLTLVGNNEDWKETATRAWFLAPEEGKYGRVFFGFENGWAQGGMNEKGLCYDWVAGYKEDWSPDPEKKQLIGNVSEKILEKAATVEEALAFFGKYNVPPFAMAKIMLVDRQGVSAIVGFTKGRLKIDLSSGSHQVLGYGKGIVDAVLGESPVLSIDSCLKTLEACIQDGTYATKYSNLYDLKNGDVHICNFHAKKKPVRLNLKKELEKGNHTYEIPKLEEQIGKPPVIDEKTLVAVAVDTALLEEYAGRYRISEKETFTVTVDEGRLLGQVKSGERTGRKNVYLAASKTKFFLRWYNQQITFIRNADGRVTEIVLQSVGEEGRGKRIE